MDFFKKPALERTLQTILILSFAFKLLFIYQTGTGIFISTTFGWIIFLLTLLSIGYLLPLDKSANQKLMSTPKILILIALILLYIYLITRPRFSQPTVASYASYTLIGIYVVSFMFLKMPKIPKGHTFKKPNLVLPLVIPIVALILVSFVFQSRKMWGFQYFFHAATFIASIFNFIDQRNRIKAIENNITALGHIKRKTWFCKVGNHRRNQARML